MSGYNEVVLPDDGSAGPRAASAGHPETMFKRLIVVCTGNICRSPIAEALLRKRLGSRVEQVVSAGTGALVGYPADPKAIDVASEYGLDIREHRAQQATLPLLASMDLILTLDQTHSDWINKQYPTLRGRVHKLLKWNGNKDIADPFRRPREAFEQSFLEIENGVESWQTRL